MKPIEAGQHIYANVEVERSQRWYVVVLPCRGKSL